jgi:hypothetical protein
MLAGVLLIAGCAGSDGGSGWPFGGGDSEKVAAADAATARTQKDLQATLMGFADTYIALKAQAIDNALLVVTMANADKPEMAPMVQQLREAALRSKVEGAEAVVEIVTGGNSRAAMFDLAVMVTLEHGVWKDFWSKRFGDDASYNMMDALTRLEKEIWTIASGEMSEAEVADLRVLAGEIRKQYITQVFVTSIRASRIIRSTEQKAFEAPKSLLAAIGLDPLSSLSPAVREVTESRLLAERVYFYVQKAPALLQWRSELMLSRSFATPEVGGLVAQLESFRGTAAKLATLGEKYPELLTAERRAALDQAGDVLAGELDRMTVNLGKERAALLEGVAAERRALLAAFDERHEAIRGMVGDAKGAVESATALSDSVGRTLERVKQLQGEPDPNAPPGRPFDIREYRDVTEKAGEAVRELNALLKTTDAALAPDAWGKHQRQFEELANGLERRVFRVVLWSALALAAAIFVSLSAVVLLHRWLRPTATARAAA